MYKATTLMLDEEVKAELVPILKKEDNLTLSSFLRRAMKDRLESHKAKDLILTVEELR